MNKEIILEQLKKMGFDPIDANECSYIFQCQDIAYLLSFDEDDDTFISFSIPHVLEITDENKLAALESACEVSRLIRYSKLTMVNDYIWVVYEYKLLGDTDFEKLIEHMIHVLKMTFVIFLKMMRYGDLSFLDDDDNDDSDNDSDEEIESELEKLLGNTEDNE